MLRERDIWALCLAVLVVGCGAPAPSAPSEPSSTTESVSQAAQSSLCAVSKYTDAARADVALLFPPLQREVRWGANSAEVERIVRRSAESVRRDGNELTAYIDGNLAWLGFEFEANRLVEVRERHNNTSRTPPFAGGFLRSIVSAHGEPGAVTEEDGGCRAVWTVDNGTITALWRDSEWFVDVYYAPPPAALERLSDAGDRIGEWCDPAWPATLTLSRGDGAAHTLSMQFVRGGRASRAVTLRNGAYHDTEGEFGEYYRIGSGGELQLFDADGFIRSATPGRCRS